MANIVQDRQAQRVGRLVPSLAAIVGSGPWSYRPGPMPLRLATSSSLPCQKGHCWVRKFPAQTVAAGQRLGGPKGETMTQTTDQTAAPSPEVPRQPSLLLPGDVGTIVPGRLVTDEVNTSPPLAVSESRLEEIPLASSVMDSQSQRRVVAGIDGSAASIQALRWALNYAALSGCATEVIVGWDSPANLGWAFPVPSDLDPEMSAEQVLDILIGQLRAEFPNQVIGGRVMQGSAAPLLVEASAGADLLVMANRGHGELVGMLLGSVSEYCVAHAHCPVLIFRGDTAQ
jgi:nucleotide-binding universal stress UspA family protein